MNNYVADTKAIVLYPEHRKPPNRIKEIFSETAKGNLSIHISAVSLMEIGYLAEKQRIDTTIRSVLILLNSNKNFVIHNLDAEVETEAFRIKTIPELHDRLIAATVSILGATLITNDPIIRESPRSGNILVTMNC